MSVLKHADSFRDLIVYQKSRQLQREIKNITVLFPKDERFSLTDQIRWSSRSIGANLAEAWAKRRYEKHFISKLTDADGEQMETQHWIDTALENDYIDQKTSASMLEKCLEVGRMLNGMMDKASMFCGEPPRTMREEAAVYFVDPNDDATELMTDHR
jgi:four helix bundle protein